MDRREDPKAASKKFEEVDRQHTLFGLGAQIAADVGLFLLQFRATMTSCIGAATRYVTLHPGSSDAAYAQYLIAASHYDQIPDISRDQGRTEKAIAALEEVIRKYPTSEYANSAKAKLEGARDQLAGKEMDVGRYYLEKRDFTPAINRFKTVVTRYQTTRHVEEALLPADRGLYGDRNCRRGAAGGGRAWARIYDSKWYKDAYNLVKSGGVEPSENKGSYISRAFKKMGLGGLPTMGLGGRRERV